MIGPTDFACHLTEYLSRYLPATTGRSTNTIMSYRDTFSLLLEFCAHVKGVAVEKITIAKLQKALIEEFLNWVEVERGCSVATRNQRLAAIHAFFRYLQVELPHELQLCQQILSIPMKRGQKRAIDYMTLEGIKAILVVPDLQTAAGRRDLVLLSLMYDTGARVQEMADLTVSDVRLTSPATIKVTGKGSKSRIVPLMTQTASLLGKYMSERHLNSSAKRSHPLFHNRSGGKLTRAGIAFILKKYVDKARERYPELIPSTVSPHSIRHSKAMHLLQAGVNLVYIRDLLGHVSITTTEIYARADSSAKRQALEGAYQNAAPSDLPVWQQNRDLLKWLRGLGK